MKAIIILIILFIHVPGQAATKIANNGILFIGDGMGPSIVTAARIWKAGSKGKLNMEKFPVTGLVRTYSDDNYVTDSAASATALATGVKTYNGAIGVSYEKTDPEKKSRELVTIIDLALKAKKSVGIITNTRVTHATPAAFYAHQASRHNEKNIAAQLVNSKISFLLGGGAEKFSNKRLKKLTDNNWVKVSSMKELKHSNNQKQIIGLFSKSHFPYALDDRSKTPALTDLVAWGIDRLSKNPRGYFLLVEGGRIDHAAHKSYVKRTLVETVEFDNAIGVALEKTDEDTLIIVTADHDTGGLSLNGYGDVEKIREEGILKNHEAFIGKRSLLTWGTGPGGNGSTVVPKSYDENFQHKAAHKTLFAAHTAVDVYVLAKGTNSLLFTGFLNNTDIPKKMATALGLNPNNLGY